MITLGTDSHKATHTVVAVDGNGRELGHRTVKATPAGHLDALRWAEQWPEPSWALEDCRHLSRRLEADLLRAGERVVRVPPKLMAGARRSARERGKSDPIDAASVARAALREPELPVAVLEGPERELRLWVDHREDLVAERTRMQNRLLWHLHELEPGLRVPRGALSTLKALHGLDAHLRGLAGAVAAIARELVDRIAELTRRVNELERDIARRVATLAPTLLALHGCGALSAAKLVGESAESGASALVPPLPAITAPHPSRCGQAANATASTGLATVSSTPPSTALPSPSCSDLVRLGTTSNGGWPPATPRPKPSEPSAGGSPTRSSVGSCMTRGPDRILTPAWGRRPE